MLTANVRYKELKNTYLFNTIYRKTSDYLDENPDKQVLRMGVGDVSLPLCEAVIKALHKAVLPTPVGPMSKIAATGRFGSARPARPRRTAPAMRSMAAS